MVTSVESKIRGGEVALRALAANGVDTIFGIPGVHTLDIYDALIDRPEIQHILARHEQGAGYMADGYARATGKPGVALIVTGPGLTNISTAVGQAYADSAPVLVLATNQERKHLDLMVGNLHEMTDQMGFMRPITKWNARVMETEDLAPMIAQAIQILGEGRPRPVHLEIPLDLLSEQVQTPEFPVALPEHELPDASLIDSAAELIRSSSRPVIFAGGGAANASVSLLLTNLAERIGAPVFTSVTGKGAIAEDHPFALGAFGYRWSADNPVADVLRGSDLAIVIGTGLGVRTTANGALPLPDRLIHIDIDSAEFETDLYQRSVSIAADAALSVSAIVEQLERQPQTGGWEEAEIAEIKHQMLLPADDRVAGYLPYLQALRAGMDRDAILVNDMTMMAYEGVRYFPVYTPRSYLFPRGFGTLGSAMPTALGAKIGCPDRQVVSIAGDGGFQFTMEELGAAKHHRIPVQIVIFNDDTHTAVKAAQRNTYPGRYTNVDLVNPDYVKIADAYGIEAIRAESPEQLQDALAGARTNRDPVLIDVPIQLENY